MTAPPDTLRNCTDCGQEDDHPRCRTVLPDQSESMHHFDCGTRRTPPCPECVDRIHASGNKSGEALRKFLRGDA